MTLEKIFIVSDLPILFVVKMKVYKMRAHRCSSKRQAVRYKTAKLK